MNRFRPNIVISGNGIPYGEDMMEMIRQEDGMRGEDLPEETRREPLATLSTYRFTTLKTGDKGPIFGQNLVNENTGWIGVGDRLKVVTTQAPQPVGSLKQH